LREAVALTKVVLFTKEPHVVALLLSDDAPWMDAAILTEP
jgi:hypothetical protein